MDSRSFSGSIWIGQVSYGVNESACMFRRAPHHSLEFTVVKDRTWRRISDLLASVLVWVVSGLLGSIH